MRIAILGNSHTACLKYALDEDPDLTRGHDIVFFASPANGMAEVNIDGKTLAARSQTVRNHLRQTSGGDGVLDPAEFDAFVIFALQVKVPRFDSYLSQAVRRAATLNAVRNSIGWRLSRKLSRLAMSKPIFLAAEPLPVSVGEGAERLTDYDTAMAPLRELCDRRGLHLIEQPPETRNDTLTTHGAFGKNSRRLLRDVPHGEEDDGHMNTDFGKIMLRHFIASLESVPVTA